MLLYYLSWHSCWPPQWPHCWTTATRAWKLQSLMDPTRLLS